MFQRSSKPATNSKIEGFFLDSQSRTKQRLSSSYNQKGSLKLLISTETATPSHKGQSSEVQYTAHSLGEIIQSAKDDPILGAAKRRLHQGGFGPLLNLSSHLKEAVTDPNAEDGFRKPHLRRIPVAMGHSVQKYATQFHKN